MKKRLVSLIVIFASVCALLLAGCSSSSTSTESQKPQKKKYIIATDATYAPFEFKKDDKYVGIDMELLDAISKLEGFDYELKPMDFKGIIPALTANQIDGSIAGMTITDQRKQSIDFSVGYFESGTSAVTRKGSNIKSEADFKGKTFAVKKGTVGAKYAEDNKDKFQGKIKYFDDTPSMFQEVSNGNADITFEDYPVIAYMISVNPSTNLEIAVPKLSTEYYGFAVNKGKNQELLNAFNDGYKKLKENGEYDKIVAKYIGSK